MVDKFGPLFLLHPCTNIGLHISLTQNFGLHCRRPVSKIKLNYVNILKFLK